MLNREIDGVKVKRKQAERVNQEKIKEYRERIVNTEKIVYERVEREYEIIMRQREQENGKLHE